MPLLFAMLITVGMAWHRFGFLVAVAGFVALWQLIASSNILAVSLGHPRLVRFNGWAWVIIALGLLVSVG